MAKDFTMTFTKLNFLEFVKFEGLFLYRIVRRGKNG